MNSLLILFYFILFSCSLLLGNAHLLLDGSFLVYNDYDLLPVVYLLGAVCQVIVIQYHLITSFRTDLWCSRQCESDKILNKHKQNCWPLGIFIYINFIGVPVPGMFFQCVLV